METSLPYHYQDYHQPTPYACGFVIQQTDNSYSGHACHYRQPHQAMVDWQSPLPDYHSSHTKFSPRLRFHAPAAFRYSQPHRGWRGRRGDGHTIASMSPPALTRCVDTVLSVHRRRSSGSHSHWHCHWRVVTVALRHARRQR